ncbi:hypothetical protein ACW73L_10165 [Methylolobus aquaticus]
MTDTYVHPRPRLPFWLRCLIAPLEWSIALIILFEEWGWEPMQRLMVRLARLPAIAALERRIASLPPGGALAVFALPTLLMLPVNVLGVWLVGQGQALAGPLVIIAAKLISTTLIARVFTLTRPVLMELRWFAHFYAGWKRWEAALVEPVRASWLWRTGRELRGRWRAWRAARASVAGDARRG